MQFLSKKDLEERTQHIFSNITVLSNEGKISLPEVNDTGLYWLEVWTHILEEFVLRFGPYPAGFTNGFIKQAEVVTPSYPEKPKAVTAIDTIGGAKNSSLYKFGKYKYLKSMYEKGEAE